MSGKDNCVCNFGDNASHPEGDGKTWCWANLQPKDPKDHSKGYLQCHEITQEKCDDSVGPDGYTCEFDKKKKVCGVVGVNKDEALSVQRAKPGLQDRKCVDCGLGEDNYKCHQQGPTFVAWNDKTNCRAWGTTGKDCRGCKGDGTMNANYTKPMPIKMPSSASCPSGGHGGGGSSDAADAAVVAAAKQALAPFEILAAAAAANVLAPVICKPLKNVLASSDDGDAKPMVQALVSLLGCDSSTPVSTPSPSPSPTQSS